MSTFKTKIDIEKIESFLLARYGGKASKPSFIKGGEISQAFSFDVDGVGFVLRVNKHNLNGFNKDLYAYKNFTSPRLPIPEIVDIGTMEDGLFYAISMKVAGNTILTRKDTETVAIVDKFLDVLDEIHLYDVSSKSGYGSLNAEGTGTAQSWRGEALGVANQDWQKRFETTFMEKDLYELLYGKLQKLVTFCPEERFLVHGDYSFDNVLSDGKSITGVIDWAQSMYGDFLYDIAWISFWPSSMDHTETFKRHYEKKGALPVNYRERIMCYQIWIALNSLGFYAYSNQKDKYDWAKGRIIGLLE